MSAEPVLHSLAISQVMLNFAADHDVDPETCLSGTDITASMLEDPEALIRPEQELRLVENLMQALPDLPTAGFELGMRYNISTFGTWGFALRTSRNLREAIELAIRYIPLSTAYSSFRAAFEDDEYIVSADSGPIPVQVREFLLHRDLGTAVNILRELNLAGDSLQRLELVGQEPPEADQVRALLRLPVHYRCQRNAVVLSRASVEKPSPNFDPQLSGLLENQCRQLMQKRQITGISGQVRQRLLGESGLLTTLEDMAGKLNMSPRSLRRKLDAETTSYRGLVEEIRQQLATQLLASTDMKLEEISAQLGYADTASFTRAFRRWFKVSPGQYREHGATT